MDELYDRSSEKFKTSKSESVDVRVDVSVYGKVQYSFFARHVVLTRVRSV